MGPKRIYFFNAPTLPRYGSGSPCAEPAWTLAKFGPYISSLNVLRAVTGTPTTVYCSSLSCDSNLYSLMRACPSYLITSNVTCLTHRPFSKLLCHRGIPVSVYGGICSFAFCSRLSFLFLYVKGSFRLSCLQMSNTIFLC